MTDLLANPRPRHPAQVEQRDAPVAQIVRRERRHAGGGAGPCDCRAEAVAAEAVEDGPLGDAIVARHKPRDGPQELGRDRDPPRPSGLRYGARDAPALPWLVDVAPGKCLE